ncbi:hypothetical protein C3920_01650 [Novacetimonas pomaceti]|uniref:Uncharacterized protein n=1 Tax=Novacetimonas pomaceti TaxID=2021998 RepID=A0ABX5P5K0_9PROT|nr:hypothetical protein C3920_01650 [Novacetimonas pomaceti]
MKNTIGGGGIPGIKDARQRGILQSATGRRANTCPEGPGRTGRPAADHPPGRGTVTDDVSAAGDVS